MYGSLSENLFVSREGLCEKRRHCMSSQHLPNHQTIVKISGNTTLELRHRAGETNRQIKDYVSCEPDFTYGPILLGPTPSETCAPLYSSHQWSLSSMLPECSRKGGAYPCMSPHHWPSPSGRGGRAELGQEGSRMGLVAMVCIRFHPLCGQTLCPLLLLGLTLAKLLVQIQVQRDPLRNEKLKVKS